VGKLGERQQALPSVWLDALLAQAPQQTEIIFPHGLFMAAGAEFAQAAMVIQQQLRRRITPLQALGIAKGIRP
jgi:hypothetical protein